MATAKENEMNTLARQSNSKTLLKACTAAVLLVTCLNAQADSNVQNLSEQFRAETLHNLQVEQIAKNVVAPSFEIFNNAAEKAAVSNNLRNETLSTIKYATNIIAPSFEIFNHAAEKAAVSKTFRDETLSSLTVDTNIVVLKPSLDNLSAALQKFVVNNPTSNIENSFTAANTKTVLESVWASKIQPSLVSFDTLDLEVEDAATNQVKLMAIDIAIAALETARTNFTLEINASL